MLLNQHKPKFIDLVDRQLTIAIAKSEFKRMKLFTEASLIGLIIMSINFFVIKETTIFFNNSVTKFNVIGWFVAFLVYEICAHLFARRFLNRKRLSQISSKP